MTYIYTLLIIIIITCLIGIYFKYKLDNLIRIINKIELCSNEMSALLKEEENLINRSINIIDRKTDIKDSVLSDIKKINSEKFNCIDKDNLLSLGNKKIFLISEEYPELKKTKSFPDILDDLKKIEDNLVALRTFHNFYAKEFNKKLSKFPYNIISNIKKYKIMGIFEGKTLEKGTKIE